MKYLLQAEQVCIAKLQSIFCVDSFRNWTIEVDHDKKEDGCLTKRVVCRQLSIFRKNIIHLWLFGTNFVRTGFGRDAVYKLFYRQRGTQTRKYLHVLCRYFRKSCNPYIPNGREIKGASDKRNYKKLCHGDISSTMFPRSADNLQRQLFENRTRDGSKHSACCHPERGLLHKTFSEEKRSLNKTYCY